jgi:hypothetical protein
VLEDPDSLAFSDTGETGGQLRGMDCRGFRCEERTQGKRTAQPLAGLLVLELPPVIDAELSRRGQGDLDIHCVRFRQGEHELPAARKLGVDRLAREKGLHLIEVHPREKGQAASLVLTEMLNSQRVRVVEGLADLAGVPARSAVGDPFALEKNDLLLRRELLQEERRPQAGEAAADDGDVGALLAGERRPIRPRGQIREPEAAFLDRLQRIRLGLRDGAPRRPPPATRRAP